MPLHDRKIKCSDWGFLIDKFGKKLQNWTGQLLSIGGRLTLTNAVLSAVPLYALSLYKLPAKVSKQFDRIRCQFLWQGTGGIRKEYALINWRTVCLAKEFFGMGVLSNNHMNVAQMVVEIKKCILSNPVQMIQLKYYLDSHSNQMSPERGF